MEKDQETKSQNQKPTTKEDVMKGTFTDLTIKDIEKHLKEGWQIHSHDKMALDAVAKTPLAELVKGHTTDVEIGGKKVTVPTLSMMKNVIVLSHPTKTTKTKNKSTKSFHLWENDQWIAVLDQAGMVVRIKKPNQKRGTWELLDNIDPNDLTYLVKTPQGSTMKDTGYIIPSVGGLNFKTGEIENVPSEPVIINRTELFHKWHDGQVRRDSVTASDSKEIAYAEGKLNEAKKAKNTDATKKWERIIEHYRSL